MSPHARRPSVVVIGGGHGCSRSLAALHLLDVERTAVVTVADDGGSSGRLRRDHQVVALGDLRMATLALASSPQGPSEALIAALARRRFDQGELAGHSLGNLLLLGLLEEYGGDLLAALAAFADLMGTSGRVLPATLEPVTLVAETPSGTVAGQAAVASARRIKRVRLDPPRVAPAPGVSDAIGSADMVLLGPGSLYTSVLPVLLIPGTADALRRTAARIVLVGNLREQPGETEGMDLADHVDALRQHVEGLRIDVVLAHQQDPGRPRCEGARVPLAIDESRIAAAVGEVIGGDLGDEHDGHDPERLARIVGRLLDERGAGAAERLPV